MASTQRGTKSGRTPLSQAIVAAVAEREGVDVTEIEPPEYEPLYDVVDPDALDALFVQSASGDGSDVGSIVLQYAGYEVTAYGDGTVELADRAAYDEPVRT